MEYFDLWFSTDFTPRHGCGRWHPTIVWVYIIGNIATWAAYVAIGLSLLMIRPKTGELVDLSKSDRRKIGEVFGTFIVVCGFGHIFDGVGAFIIPTYHLYAAYHCLTALVSWRAVRYVIRYRSRILVGV